MSTTKAPTAAPITVSVAEAARLTGLSEWSIRQLVWSGLVASRRHGRRVLVSHASLTRYIDDLEQVAA